MRVYLLIGNTSIKVAADDGPARSFAADATREVAGFLNDFADAALVAASVNPAADKVVEAACRQAGAGLPVYAGRDFPTGVELEVSSPETVGMDRILNVKAAFHRCAVACAAVDLGTAVSVSVADGAGRFVGGAILPGLGLASRSLHEATAFLPLVAPGVPDSPLGRETAGAIQSGIIYGAVGAVKEIVERVSSTLGCELEVFLTGGDCQLVSKVCPAAWHVVPALTLEGLRLAYEESLA